MTVFIYCLSDPDTGEVRYIGKTKNLKSRFSGHTSRKNKCWSSYWIWSLRNSGKMPIMEELERIENSDDKDWQEVERFYIAYFRFLGARLTNLDGGGIMKKGRHPSTGKRFSLANKGRKKTPEQIEKTASKNRGRKREPFSQEWKDKISKTLTGRKMPEETRLKMIANKKPFSEEALERIRKSATGRKHSPEAKEKIRQWHLGRRPSQATIERLRTLRLGKTFVMSEERKIKIGNANRGKKHPPLSKERCDAISKVHKGRVWSPEHREKALSAMRATVALKKLKRDADKVTDTH